ncbi:MAG: HD-GYP domain-containing protein [Candidatus Limnocylindria bacterium]
MSRIRWPLRLYIVVVIAVGLAAVGLGSQAAVTVDPGLWPVYVVLLVVATAARLRPIHLSPKFKVNVDDTATFAAALLFGPLLAMLLAGAAATAAMVLRRTRGSWHSRAFNVSVAVIGCGSAAAVFRLLGGADASVLRDPAAAGLAALVLYLVPTLLVDGVIALQLRRSVVATWWPLHRRDVAQHATLLVLGALLAAAASLHPWAIALFIIPVAGVYGTLRESARLHEQTRLAIYELADLVDKRDAYTYGHSLRVAEYAERLARKLKLSQTQIDLVREAARMHDVGKISTPDRVLNKQGPLDVHELAEMHRHAEDGARLLARLPEFWEGAALVRTHHERYDGSGYPRGLAGVEIPLEATAIAVADAYDAMATDRPYRNALSWDAIRAEFERGRGTQWSPTVVDAFVSMIEQEHETARRPHRASVPTTA